MKTATKKKNLRRREEFVSKLIFEQNLLQYGILRNIWPKVKFFLKWIFIFI